MKQSYKTLKDMKQRDLWLKKNGYNPCTFFDPDLDINLIRAKASVNLLLTKGYEFLSTNEINFIHNFKNKSKATKKQIFQILNLKKRINRLIHQRYSRP